MLRSKRQENNSLTGWCCVIVFRYTLEISTFDEQWKRAFLLVGGESSTPSGLAMVRVRRAARGSTNQCVNDPYTGFNYSLFRQIEILARFSATSILAERRRIFRHRIRTRVMMRIYHFCFFLYTVPLDACTFYYVLQFAKRTKLHSISEAKARSTTCDNRRDVVPLPRAAHWKYLAHVSDVLDLRRRFRWGRKSLFFLFYLFVVPYIPSSIVWPVIAEISHQHWATIKVQIRAIVDRWEGE